MRVLPQDMYFHAFTSTRRVFPHVYFHEACTLHDMSKRGPRKHVTGMHCSIVVVPRKIMREKMKLQLSGTVVHIHARLAELHLYKSHPGRGLACKNPILFQTNHKLVPGDLV